MAERNFYKVIVGTGIIFLLFVLLTSTVFDVQYDYTLQTVAIGGAILGMVAGVLGSFAILRRESLMGDALSHAALPGVAIGFLIGGRELSWLMLGAASASWLAVLVINAIIRTTRIKQDAAMGIVLTSFFATGIVLLTYIQGRNDASQAGLDKFIFGQAAAIKRDDIMFVSVLGMVAFTVLALFWKEFKLITFDREFAGANGYPLRWLETLLSTLIVIAIVMGLQIAGVILMVGLLIAPGVAARQWTNDLGKMVILAGVFGAFAGASGAITSGIDANLPTGPLIIVVAFIVVFISVSLAPGRGMVWHYWQQWHDQRRFAGQHVLRDIYQHAKSHGDLRYPAQEGMLITLRGQTARVGIHQLEQQGVLECVNQTGWRLTDVGVQRASADARNQDLWLAYREYADDLELPIIPENHQQDIREVLPENALAKLETVLGGR